MTQLEHFELVKNLYYKLFKRGGRGRGPGAGKSSGSWSADPQDPGITEMRLKGHLLIPIGKNTPPPLRRAKNS